MGLSTLRVLIIDNDRDEAHKLLVLLNSLGYDAQSVAGNSLADTIRTFQPDVLLSDHPAPALTEDKQAIVIDAQDPSLIRGILERQEDLLFAEAEMYQRDIGRDFTNHDVERLELIRDAFKKYNYFGGSSIVGRFVKDLPQTISLQSMNRPEVHCGK